LELSRTSVQAFIDDEGLTRGAAIAFYTIMSIGPVLFIVVAIAGLAFGEDAARGAISGQLSGLMGQQSVDLLQTAIRSAAGNSAGFLAAATGIVTLVITASGVFSEMQQSLNVIWRMTPRGTTVARVIRARAASSWYPSLSAPWSQPSVSTSTLTCRSATWSFGSGLQEIGILASS
jgi:membrane protein